MEDDSVSWTMVPKLIQQLDTRALDHESAGSTILASRGSGLGADEHSHAASTKCQVGSLTSTLREGVGACSSEGATSLATSTALTAVTSPSTTEGARERAAAQRTMAQLRAAEACTLSLVCGAMRSRCFPFATCDRRSWHGRRRYTKLPTVLSNTRDTFQRAPTGAIVQP
eukprot:scaffold3159_cov393-Prasinococcus_capsulatus_cf.AAC.19